MTIDSSIYGSLSEAQAYFDDRLHEVAWSAASVADRRKSLVQATRIIDTLSYKGNKAAVYQLLEANEAATDAEIREAEASQATQFPRGSDTEVPEAIRIASYEIAYALLDGVDPQLELEALGVSSAGLESVRATYSRQQKPVDHIINGVPSASAWRRLLPFLRDDRSVKLYRT
ncbi:MAG: hypothetical protein ACTHOU_16480 [Aureliella sp.]